MSVDLVYHPGVMVEDLPIGGCTVRRTRLGDKLWWALWLYVRRADTGEPTVFEVPIHVRGPYTEDPVAGKMWGFTKSLEAGVWQVSPSINVLVGTDVVELHPGAHPSPSVWHETPRVVGVPEGEPWDA